MEFKEFKVEDVFGKAQHRKYHSPETLIVDPSGYPYICASNVNNGINQKMPRVIGDNLQLTPAPIIAWGKQCPMFCYHDEPCVTAQGMYFLDMRGYSEEVCLYVCAVLSRACSGQYSYSNCLIGSKMDDTIISLPVHTVTVPDFDALIDAIGGGCQYV